VPDRKVAVHSLRHSLKDTLRRARVQEPYIDMTLGHCDGATKERYGSDEARLELVATAMRAEM
jgi:integrase